MGNPNSAKTPLCQGGGGRYQQVLIIKFDLIWFGFYLIMVYDGLDYDDDNLDGFQHVLIIKFELI